MCIFELGINSFSNKVKIAADFMDVFDSAMKFLDKE